MTKLKYFKILTINGTYEDFTDFYDDNKGEIYKTIIEIFHEFKNTRKKSLTMYVCAKIKNLEWDTEFNFKRTDLIVLKRDVMTYFEQIEDYDTCCEVRDLHKSLCK